MTTSVVPQGWGRSNWGRLSYGEGRLPITAAQVAELGQVTAVVGIFVPTIGVADVTTVGTIVVKIDALPALLEGIANTASVGAVQIESLWTALPDADSPTWTLTAQDPSSIWHPQQSTIQQTWVELNPNNA